jgi:hypothetical protein
MSCRNVEIALLSNHSGEKMKDARTLRQQYTTTQRRMTASWESPLWEDFPELDLEDEEPPFDAELDDLARGSK